MRQLLEFLDTSYRTSLEGAVVQLLIIFLPRTHAERAIELMLRLLPEDHLLLSSSKRVKALILEEMAIDNPNKDVGECNRATSPSIQ